jgi:1-hydroxycarotenoid 3,4-desaturase
MRNPASIGISSKTVKQIGHCKLSKNYDSETGNLSTGVHILKSVRAVVIGGGVAGLTAALDLARSGLSVTLFERGETIGGKIRATPSPAGPIDCGPTVLTMRAVFDEIFENAGSRLADNLTLTPAETLARHAWSDGSRLDLHADLERSADAIGDFAGAGEADGFRRFMASAKRVFETLETGYIRADRASLPGLVRSAGLSGLPDLMALPSFVTLTRALERHFRDPRLVQLFGRYATYCGSSPYLAPATLMLVAHVEQCGVWLIEGGIRCLAGALAGLAEAQGVEIRTRAHVASIEAAGGRPTAVVLASGERIAADVIVCNADGGALASGRFGAGTCGAVPALPRAARSLSALTFTAGAAPRGLPLARHTVFFSDDYPAEFRDIFDHRRLPRAPTVYVCAEDRDGAGINAGPAALERLFILVNAPPDGDTRPLAPEEIARCQTATVHHLNRCGLNLTLTDPVITTPADFETRFPATGGALYGRATHGWISAFRRPGPWTRMPGLYIAGGSAHPGPGMPMAALSGRAAARAVLKDLASKRRWFPAAMPGGTSTASPTTAGTPSR